LAYKLGAYFISGVGYRIAIPINQGQFTFVFYPMIKFDFLIVRAYFCQDFDQRLHMVIF